MMGARRFEHVAEKRKCRTLYMLQEEKEDLLTHPRHSYLFCELKRGSEFLLLFASMAGYYDRDAVDDFDDYDPEPYSGGYDQLVAYGKPIHPSEDTCYAPSVPRREEDESNAYAFGSESSPYGDRIDVERPMQGSGSEPSHGTRPKPQPASDFDEPPPYKSDEFGQRPQSPGWSPPSHEENEYGYSEERKKPSYGEEDPYKKPHKPSYGQEEGEGWKKSSFNKGEEDPYEKPQGEAWNKFSYGEEDSYKKPEKPSYGQGEVEGWKKPSYGEEAEEPVPEPPRFERPSYHGGEEDPYKKPHRPSYGQEEGEGWNKSSYGEEDSYKKPQRPSYGEDEGEGWKKSGYGEEAEEPVPEPSRFERPSYNGGEEDPYKKHNRPIYGQGEEEMSPRFGTPTYRPDEGTQRTEYGGEEYEEKRYERPSPYHRRDSYTDE